MRSYAARPDTFFRTPYRPYAANRCAAAAAATDATHDGNERKMSKMATCFVRIMWAERREKSRHAFCDHRSTQVVPSEAAV